MILKITLNLLLIVFTLLGVSAYAGEAPEKPISSETAHGEFSEGWWRSVRFDTWVWEGADPAVLTATLERISSAVGERRYSDLADTIVKYGPGHWTYEFSVAGDKAYEKARDSKKSGDVIAARQYFLEASYYYTHGSYPHLRDSHSQAALAKAFNAYAEAGRYFSTPLEIWEIEVDDVVFKAMVHWPMVTDQKLVPVVLKTSGLDVLSTEFYPLAKTLNELGVAMISFDLPGTGNNGILDENMDKHHVAVLDRVLQDVRFDKNRIAVWSNSVGGWAGARMAFNHGEYLAASVAGCALVHNVYTLGIVVPGPEGDKVRKLIQAYRNDELSRHEIDAFNKKWRENLPNFRNQGRDFQAVAFLDRIRSTEGDLLDTISKTLPMSLMEQGYIGENRMNVYDTPLLVINTTDDPIVPTAESILISQASSQGKLMLFDDHKGHCVSRTTGNPPTVKWLSYHMRLENN